jgi:hypothetical protein
MQIDADPVVGLVRLGVRILSDPRLAVPITKLNVDKKNSTTFMRFLYEATRWKTSRKIIVYPN